MTKISVILATFQSYKTLPRAIDSILNQTIRDIEFIIVDDGSNDHTPDLLRDYASKDKRIKVVTQTNQGLAAARNNGVAEASAKYIAFIDSDDACAVNHLEFHYNFLENNTQYSACVLSDVASINDYYPGIAFMGKKEYSICHGSPFDSRRLLGALGSHSFMRRNSIIKVGGYRGQKTIIEDLDFILRYSHYFSFAKIDGEGSYFYTAPENNTPNKLTNSDVPILIKRHMACYISEWYRINNINDPVEEDKSLDEIINMIKTIPIKDRVIIYWSMRYFIKILSIVDGMSERAAKYYLLGLLSDNRLLRKIIDIQYKRLLKTVKKEL